MSWKYATTQGTPHTVRIRASARGSATGGHGGVGRGARRVLGSGVGLGNHGLPLES